ncbi:max-binding protein MNT-like isoform X2 [Dendropsophus ebraccatus]|uniref:max-binding protein MNT-like isoform X2 n=1 Tax=Dendropsophus ebraccatus TaxID=150705 RepID=UPI003832254A
MHQVLYRCCCYSPDLMAERRWQCRRRAAVWPTADESRELGPSSHSTPPRTDPPTPPPLKSPAPLTPSPARTRSPQRMPPPSSLSSNAPTLGDCPGRFSPEPTEARPLSASGTRRFRRCQKKTVHK